ncbi:hypothetical protein KEM48_004703 [Puccinia striiformis f. sp. tritici PST-130]|nr:hypothetical protein KEM48_004703 [Puccinia striiformis f. sp. tritici PST-130]
MPRRISWLVLTLCWKRLDSFIDLQRTTMQVDKVREYDENLESVCRNLMSDQVRLHRWGGVGCFTSSNTQLGRDQERHTKQIKEPILLAHLKRHPKSDASNLSDEDIVASLETGIPTANKKYPDCDSVHINWSGDARTAGFRAGYRDPDLVLIPNLALLPSWAEDWLDKPYKAPSTSIVGPTKISKTRILVEFAKHVCVADVIAQPCDTG